MPNPKKPGKGKPSSFGSQSASAIMKELKVENLETQIKLLKTELEEAHFQLEDISANSNRIIMQSELVSIELTQIFNASLDGIWVIGKDHKVLRINDALLAILGLKREEVIGQNCFDLFPSHRCHTKECPLEQIKGGKEFLEYDISRGKSDFILTITPFRGTVGELLGTLEIYKDISKRKKLENQLKSANRELKKMAVTDGLTQIPNRRRFQEHLDTEWRRMKRDKQPLSLIMCDIDHFKLYNDNEGHQAGDRCLKKVAQAIKKNLKRAGDLVARYGGEEFAIILPNTLSAGAEVLAKQIQGAIKKLKLPHANSPVSPNITISMGIGTLFPNSDSLPRQLINQADHALYEAKENGRNCIIMGGEEVEI